MWILSRWYVHWRTEWVGWISSRDAIWSYSCSIHTDYQRNVCNGKILIYFIFAIFFSIIYCFVRILTLKVLQLEKYKNYDFGRCPRVYCCGQPCLPVGQSDIPRSSTVKIYCPKCEDIYYPRSKYQGSILIFLLASALKLLSYILLFKLGFPINWWVLISKLLWSLTIGALHF